MGKLKYIGALVSITALYVAVSTLQKSSIVEIVLFVSILWILPISLYFGYNLVNRETSNLARRLKDVQYKRGNLDAELKELNKERKYLEEKLSSLSRLYAITKELSRTMKFNELCTVLHSFLEDNFAFRKFSIVLVKGENSNKIIDRVYEIDEGKEVCKEPDDTIANIVNEVMNFRIQVFIKDEKRLKALPYEECVKNIFAIPLVIHENVIASIVIENIKEDEKDKFLILAPQLALQVERIRLFDDVERLSITDGLTETYLRRYFLERFDEEIKRAEEAHLDLSFIMIDIDHFKKCNDMYGHLVGDVMLKEVAGIIKENVREIDFVARYGGEEFCILLPETNKRSAYNIGERIRKFAENRVVKAYDESVKITLSMGVSSFPEDAEEARSILDKADKALYEAKRKGRNQVCVAL